MSDEPAELAIKFSAILLDEKRKAVSAAEEDLATSIRAALRMGVSATRCAAAAGITRARVYQIRDNRR